MSFAALRVFRPLPCRVPAIEFPRFFGSARAICPPSAVSGLRQTRRGSRVVLACLLLGLSAGIAPAAQAAVALLQPPREAAADRPLAITLLYSNDGQTPLTIAIPQTLRVTLTNGDQPAQALDLAREPRVPATLRLRPGQYRKVQFSANWPASARGVMQVDVPGLDASPALIALDRKTSTEAAVPPAGTASAASSVTATGATGSTLAAGQPGEPQAAAPRTGEANGAAAALPGVNVSAADDALATTDRGFLSRLSYYQPTYIGVGANGGTTARFQLSFKYRILMPDDVKSKSLLDNLYFAYTQTSIWDLSADSRPFRDTSYMPELFYSIADTGWRSPLFTRMGIAAGIGHESNGKAGSDSRGINMVFVRPTWEFGNLAANHLTVSPKFYYYVGKSDNADIADYRGYVDLLVKYGSPNGLQLATTIRKGTKHWYGSVDTQLTYPLAKLLGSAWGGYIWVGYFNGYGEDILDYNQRQHWVARIGYAIAR